MNELEKISKDVPTSSLQNDKIEEKVSIEDIIDFFTNKETDKNNQLITGRVFQKNKKLKFTENFFKLIEEEVNKFETKNNKDLDVSFFNLNKKILSNNLYNIKEIINLYNIDEGRLIMFLVGTVIQSIYDKKD
jgi:hypothetical protein